MTDTDITARLDDALERAEAAEIDAALYYAIALRVLAMLSTGGQPIEAIVAGVNRDLARDLVQARRACRLPAAFDRAARAITGRSADELNAALEIEVREYPHTFDPSGGHQ